MSVKIMGQVWDLDLPANKLLVLLAMADHADHEGNNIFPSRELIAWKTGYSIRQVQRIINSLVADGILKSTKRPGETTLYRIDISKGKLKHPRGVGQNVTPPVTSNVTPTCDITVSPKPSLEPSIKDSNTSKEDVFTQPQKQNGHVSNEMLEAVTKALQLNGQMAASLRYKYVHFLQGTVTTKHKGKDYFDLQIAPGLTVEEVAAFGEWYRVTKVGCSGMRSFATIHMNVAEWRAAKQKAAPRVTPIEDNTPPPLSPEVMDAIRAEVAS